MLGLLIAVPVAAHGLFFDILMHYDRLLMNDHDEQILRGIRHGWFTAAVLVGVFVRGGIIVCRAANAIASVGQSLSSPEPTFFGPNFAAAPAICLFAPLAIACFLVSENISAEGHPAC